jgi:hypothetical protein
MCLLYQVTRKMVVMSSLSGFRIPVTRSSGFICSHVADRPVSMKSRITVFDNLLPADRSGRMGRGQRRI